jgi:hypothetical protein
VHYEVSGRLLTGTLVMSEKKLSKVKDQLELTVLIFLFVISIAAVSPPGV